MALILQPPPLPQLSVVGTIAAAASGLLLSIMLVLWGRTVGKIIITLICVAVGAVVGSGIAEHLGVNVWAGRTVGALACGVAGYLLCVLVWAVVVSLAGLAFAGSAIITHAWSRTAGAIPDFLPMIPKETEYFKSLQFYCEQAFEYIKGVAAPAWEHYTFVVLAIIGGFWLVPLLMGLLRPRFISIFASSLLGAAGLVGISTGIIWWAWKDCPLETTSAAWLALGCSTVVLTWGVIWQYRSALRAGQQTKPSEESPQDAEE